MQTSLLLGGQTFYLGSSTNPAVTTGGGIMDLQAGTINLQNGTLAGSGNTSNLVLTGDTIFTYNSATNPAVTINDSGGCSPTCANSIFSVVGSATVAGTFTANSFIYQGSDIRLKKNIIPLVDPLADIMKLKPVAFTYRTGGKDSMGVIAQDIEKVYPQLVAENSQGLKMVSYEGLIAPLIGSVQELKKENEGLRDILRAQVARQDQLEKEIKELRSK